MKITEQIHESGTIHFYNVWINSGELYFIVNHQYFVVIIDYFYHEFDQSFCYHHSTNYNQWLQRNSNVMI